MTVNSHTVGPENRSRRHRFQLFVKELPSLSVNVGVAWGQGKFRTENHASCPDDVDALKHE